MSVFFRPTPHEVVAMRRKEAAVKSASLIVFRRMAENGELDDDTIADHAVLFDVWNKEDTLYKGCIRRCPETGELFRSLDVTNSKTKATQVLPSKADKQWEIIADGGSEKTINGATE